jgi:ABC-type branched-subunit amino acid transport system substrate-binding protein
MRWRSAKEILAGLSAAALAGVLAADALADIKIGAFGPMTGDAAGYGQSLREAVDLAVKEKNAAGGVLGQKIVVVYGDDAGKPEQAVSVAKRLATSDEVLVMLGSVSSPASFASSQVALQSETPQIVISGTAQRITTQGNPWVFRSAIPDTKFAGDLVDFMAAPRLSRLCARVEGEVPRCRQGARARLCAEHRDHVPGAADRDRSDLRCARLSRTACGG